MTGTAYEAAAARRPKCPRCFSHLPDDQFAWKFRDPDEFVHDEIASAYSGKEITSAEVHVDEPLPAGVSIHEVVEACPICHYELPPRWREGEVTCVAMAGARYTGKTVYLAVLVKQLERLAEQYDREVIPADHTTAERYRVLYETPLFVERGIVQATPSALTHVNDPLIFNLGHWQGVPRYLALRDVAGEDLENPHQINPTVLSFFQLADAVFFLFDPLRVEEIANQLRDLIPVPDELGGDPREVLRTVMGLIADNHPQLAVIISKFNALQQLAAVANTEWSRIMLQPGAAFNRDPGLTSRYYDQMDGELLDAEVRSLLHRLNAGPQIRAMRNPVTGAQYPHRLFAVSALGESPAGKQLHPNGISPFRCADPVRWLYAGRGVFEDDYPQYPQAGM
ncbi:MAG: hypothetical protein QM809_04460 [Gordonia sp. (in: high G+C Gram-positive bacteria)]|uniref:hypothetical protein n=1 Tax=Gordonia sp. (in: high G+C Gram-positive bacteria) TaxID=84139 RepID=UPI0039E63BEE